MSIRKELIIKKILEKNKEKERQSSTNLRHELISQNIKIGPLSPAQMRIYTLHKACGENDTAYNTSEVMLCEPHLAIDHVRSVFDKVVHRHDILRTSFHEENGIVTQYVHDEVDIELTEEILDGVDLQSWLNTYFKPFDLTKPGQIRLALVTLNERQYMVFDSHHIIVDGMSSSIINKELASIYMGNDLPDPKFQYLDYVFWNKEFIASREYKSKSDYWNNQLASPLPILDLPTDYSRPNVQRFNGGSKSFSIDSLSVKLKKLLSEENTTLHSGLLAIYSIFLYKITGQDDVVIGSPVLGRTNSAFQNMPGMFGNTLPIRLGYKKGTTFRDYLSKVKSTILDAINHQEFDISDIVRSLNHKRDPSRNPLFDTLFVLQVENLSGFENSTLSLIPQEYNRNRAQLDLSLEALDKGDYIRFKVDYALSLFGSETINRFIEQFTQLIENVTDNPDLDIAVLSLMSCEEIEAQSKYSCQLLEDDLSSIIEIFESNVSSYTNKVAVELDNVTFTYGELSSLVNNFGSILISNEVTPGTKVCLLMDRSIEMIAIILAVIRVGGVYVPIEPDMPEDRIDFIIKDCEATHIVTDSKSVEVINNITEHNLYKVINIGIQDVQGTDTSSAPAYPATLSDAIYIIYTSGTTGQPKGVIVEQRCVIGLLKKNELPSYDETDRWSMFHSYSFDFSVWEIFAPLLSGGTLVITPKDTARDTHNFIDFLEKNKITVLNQTPSAFYNLIEVDKHDGYSANLELRSVIFGGEALSPSRLESWSKSRPNTKLINMYGITETTVHTTYKELAQRDLTQDSKSNIGKALQSHYVYILDNNMQHCAVGVVGEMYVGGISVARGYLNRKPLTQDRFISDPFCPGKTIYKSGDLAKRNDEGDLIYIGRCDKQIKIRGHRIEMGEVEQVILSCDGIYDVSVFDHIDSNSNHILGAAICSKHWDSSSDKILIGLLKRKLPQYMIPSVFVNYDTLPLTVSGKIDTNRLINDIATIDSDNNRSTPAEFKSNTERELATIWRSIFGNRHITSDSDFFELGGHSLLATTMLLQVNKKYRKNIGLDGLYGSSTITAFSQLIDSQGEHIDIQKIQKNEYRKCLPTSAQKRLYFIEETSSIPSTTYNIPLVFKWEGEIC
jgi:amino acid adenylation domain-containing protein